MDSPSPLEALRELNIKRNAMMRLSLGIVDVADRKLPVFSKRVVKSAPRDLSQSDNDELPYRTPSRAGKWRCVPGCTSTFVKVNALVRHLRDLHHLPQRVRHLVPLGLALCPFCGGVFEALRGITVHVISCRAAKRPLCSLVGGDFPRRCFVWWESKVDGMRV